MKLLFFASDYKIGLTQANTEVVIGLYRSGKVDMLCASSENEQEKGLHKKLDDVRVPKCIIQGLDVHNDFKKKALEISKIITGNFITHVNVQNNWQLALLAYVRLRYGLHFKLIYTIHGYRHNSSVKAAVAIGVIGLALLLFADRVISMSSYVSRRFWFLRRKTDIVFYIMNKPQYAKAENHIAGSPLRLVFPAQFRYGKNQQVVICAVKRYIEQTGDDTIRLYLPGDGARLDEMKSLAARLKIDKNVIFPGKLSLDGVLELYEKCNIALCASNVETYGRCIAEPFMLGRCLLTRNTGVALDIIRDGENGLLFDGEEDLARQLVKLHDNPGIVVKMGNQAFVDRKVFSAESVIDSYLHVISKA